MRLITTLIISFLSIGLYANDFYMQDEVFQGEPITFVISPVTDNLDYTFTIYNSNGNKILDVKGFNYYFYEEMTSMILGLGGIPSNLPPGSYMVKATGRGPLNSFFFERPLIVKDANYKKSVLKANDKMDSILNGEINEDREEQSRRLWDVFTSYSKFILHEEGTLSKPVDGRHSSPYGFQRVTTFPNGKESISVHKGEDLAAKTGTPVLSVGRGRVLLAENRIVTGNTVVVEHLPGVISVFYHMDSLSVVRGYFLKKGDKIGEVGSTGYSTGPHVHWEIRISSVPVNPMLFLEKPLIDKSLILNMIISTK
jgi:hypothetical protein